MRDMIKKETEIHKYHDVNNVILNYTTKIYFVGILIFKEKVYGPKI
jgi:hypothetical protein